MFEDDEFELKVFGWDESLQTLGNILASKTSLKIYRLISEKEMYMNDIAKSLKISMNNTIHHLKKLEDAGMVKITYKKIIRKGIEHKFYKAIPNILISNTYTNEQVKSEGFFKRFFKDGVKFAAIGLAAITSLLAYSRIETESKWSGISDVDSISLEIPFLIIIVGLVLERIYSHIKNKKKR